MSSLYVLRGKDQGQRFYLNLPLIRIGRDRENDIQLRDSEVSRRHAHIIQRAGQFVFEDLESANGSIVNSGASKTKILVNGDHIQLGRSLLLFTAKVATNNTQSPPVKLKTSSTENDDAAMSEAISQVWRSGQRQDLASPTFNIDANDDGHLNIMYQTALAVSHTLDIDQLLVRIMELILQWVQADRGCIFLLDPETDQPIAKAARYRNSSNSSQQIEVSRTILDYVLKNEEGVLTSNAADDARFDEAESVMQMGIREAICVPMRGRYGVVGAIYVDTSSLLAEEVTAISSPSELFGKRFKQEHLQLMVAIGNQSGIAIEDTTFYSGLVKSERLAAIGQTIAVMSHHIKNILQGFQGGGYLLEQGIKNQEFEVIQQGWSVLQRNQDRVFNLVMDMLSYSKDREPLMEPGNLNELITDVVSLVQTKANSAEVPLLWNPVADFPVASFDHESLHRAVLNVVSNAIDASRDAQKPKVEIRLRQALKPSPRIEIWVRDEGCGIEPEDMDKIFSLFESTKGGRGTGLGLPVSRKIMKEHDGDIDVQSVVEQGTEFTLWFPLSDVSSRSNTENFQA